MILYLIEQGADIMVLSRSGQTIVDMANGPIQRVPPFRETIDLLVNLGAKNNNNCVSCQEEYYFLKIIFDDSFFNSIDSVFTSKLYHSIT